ncbi:putative zinc finger in N-recognin-domain-containing protein [Aspergillus ambiguus]|uniref:putative metaphase-anaphase transition protein (Mlo2) n=1 Tax=Aspergillus ambiguus TaxID=176160 RepID=UPI003CCCC8DE
MNPSEPVGAAANTDHPKTGQDAAKRRESFSSQNSQTAKEFIESQMRLEADAREVMPYSFDSCTQALGPLRQSLFACLTCNPPPATPDAPFTAAGVCYSCSIACHGEHTLVELFNKRNFVCDCGTTRVSSGAPCTLRSDPKTGANGVRSEEPHPGNRYNHNFRNTFCGCGENYDAEKEKGTMFQCLGLGTAETGGCGEDWWHPECLIGLPRDWYKKTKDDQMNAEADDDDDEIPLPPGFPAEDDFETFLCYKCVESNPWLKRYAGTAGFLSPVSKEGGLSSTLGNSAAPAEDHSGEDQSANSKKRKLEDDGQENGSKAKRTKEVGDADNASDYSIPEKESKAEPEAKEQPVGADKQIFKHDSLPKTSSTGVFSLFVKEDFRDHFCRCPECYPNLAHHPQLREEEETYEPPLSDDGEANGGGSTGTGSLLDRGEAALSNIDRVRAIEGAMVYNHLRDKVKEFLKPFAESGTAVSADDIKSYFEKLRGDDEPMKDAAGQASAASNNGNNDNEGDDHRREQNGY